MNIIVTKKSEFVVCCSLAQLCLTLCDPMDCTMPGFLVLHYPSEFAQTHVHWVGNAIQPSHPFVAPFSSGLHSFPASESFSVSQLLTSGGQSIGALASNIPVNIQGWVPLGLTGLISFLFKGLSRFVSSTTVWKQQFFGAQPSLLTSSHISTWLLENHSFDHMDFCQ